VEPVEFLAHTEPVAEATGPLLRWLDGLDQPDGLTEYPVRLARLARQLAAGGGEAPEVTQVITAVNDVLTATLLRLVSARLGHPPRPYAWLVLGSGGRREQALLSDQDSALVYAAAGDGAAETGEYFAALADATVTHLAAAGLPRCPGGFMATAWQHSLDEWRGIFRNWVERPDPQTLVEAEVFLDFRRVHGQLTLDPLDDILRAGAGYPRFLLQMARAAVAFTPPVGLFGRIKAPGHEVDLKRGGIAAIVLLARLYALAAGSVVRPTLDRLAAAADGGTLSRSGAERLAQHYRFLTDLRLRTQLGQAGAGGRPDNRVRLDRLGPDDLGRLQDALRAVRELQQMTALRFQTELVT
jgi:CBS domain-containing protein